MSESSNSTFQILAADREGPFPFFDMEAAKIGAKMVYGGASTPEQLETLVDDADAVIVFRTPVSARAIERMKKCKIILRQGIGFDLVDVPAATKAGIFVSNVPDYCIEEVASHAMALLLAIVRNLRDYDRLMREKGWGFYNNASRLVPPMDEMKLGIVGLGKIGRSFARKAQAFGFKLSAYDPYLHDDVFQSVGAERKRQLEELLKQSDVVSLHVPLTPETRGMFGAAQFAMMKHRSYFINTARGKIVDLTALIHALKEGPLAAAALDVFEDEPLDPNHPILKLEKVVLTPHVAFYSERSIRRVVAESIAEVVRTLQGSRPLNLVNPEVYAHRRAQ